jgi:hypothetical protein
MDWKKIVGVVVAALIAVAGSILGYNFKADVCGEPAPAVVAE